MKHKHLIPLIMLLSMVLADINPLAAQQGRVLTLKEAIDLSIKNSKQLKGSKARIEEATANLKEAVERRLPEAAVSGSYIRLNNPNIDLKTKSNSNSGSGGTQPQSTGNPSSVAYGLLNGSLPIYSGLRIRYGIESSKYLEGAAKLDADNDRE